MKKIIASVLLILLLLVCLLSPAFAATVGKNLNNRIAVFAW